MVLFFLYFIREKSIRMHEVTGKHKDTGSEFLKDVLKNKHGAFCRVSVFTGRIDSGRENIFLQFDTDELD